MTATTSDGGTDDAPAGTGAPGTDASGTEGAGTEGAPQHPLTFVVGTGRCGSTALSEVLRLHPDVLSISELITTVEPGALPAEPLTGAEFWALLASPRPFADRMIREGTPLPEHLYPRVQGRRHSARDGIPALYLTTLPHLTDDPDGLFDALAPVLSARPRSPVAAHYRALFGALAAHLGRHAVVERSGFSLRSVRRLREVFPEAGFVHLHRSGPDCALSMSRHPGFRLMRAATDAASGERDDVPAELAQLLADDAFDVRAMLERPVPVERFGELWSDLIIEGLALLAEVPAPLRRTLAYEDLVAAPERELARLAAHIGVAPHADWLAAGRAVLDGGRRGASAALGDGDLAALRAACAPGTRALAAARSVAEDAAGGPAAGVQGARGATLR